MNDETQQIEPTPEKNWFVKLRKSFFGEILQIIVISLIIVIPFRIYIAQPFLVSGASMDDTFTNGQYLIVDELTYQTRDPLRGEVVIFRYPLDTKKYFIKRVIGLPGETVNVKNGIVTIVQGPNIPDSGLTLNEPYTKTNNDNTNQPEMNVILEPTEYFVMGDNRSNSSDSRIWGPVKVSLITGRPFFRLLPLNKMSFFPGQFTIN